MIGTGRHLSLALEVQPPGYKSHFIQWNFTNFSDSFVLQPRPSSLSSFFIHDSPLLHGIQQVPTSAPVNTPHPCSILMDYYLRSSTYNRNPFHLDRISHLRQKNWETLSMPFCIFLHLFFHLWSATGKLSRPWEETIPETNSSPVKIGRPPKGKFNFQPSFLGGELVVSERVSFQWRKHQDSKLSVKQKVVIGTIPAVGWCLVTDKRRQTQGIYHRTWIPCNPPFLAHPSC